MPIRGNIRHVRSWSKAIAINFSSFFYIEVAKIAKISKDKCSHCAMAYLSTAPSNRIIALWVHPFRLNILLPSCQIYGIFNSPNVKSISQLSNTKTSQIYIVCPISLGNVALL